MSQWLKKVGDTPLRSNGFILDSFATNDSKEFNAPSIRAVEERTDNNLIFGSNFRGVPSGAHDDASLCGWTIEGSDIDQFFKGDGIRIVGDMNGDTTTHTIYSPKFYLDNVHALDSAPAFSLSLEIEQGDYSSGEDPRDPFIAKLENIVSPYNPQSMPVFDDPRGYFEIKVNSILDGVLAIDFINYSNKDFYIHWIKFEIGEACTSYHEINKDESTRDAILKAVNDFLLVEKVTVATSAIPPYAMAETGGAKNIAKEGYKALGVVGLKFPNDVTYSSMYTGYLGGSGDMLYYVITNLTASEKTNSFDAYILYQRIF